MKIPEDLLPRDGRFGSGPTKVRPEALAALAATGTRLLGTSHRQAPVRRLVGSVRERLATLLGAPDGYEVVLGNGGATVFWDAVAFGLVRSRTEHLVHGEFGQKVADVMSAAPFLDEPVVVRSEPFTHPDPVAEAGVDLYAWPHNETSTGVMSPVRRVEGADDDALVVIDGTSGAGGLPVDLSACDVYYLSPQKNLASDGGLWFAVMSPRALDRVAELAASDRWIPRSLDLAVALENSRADQTYNTPPLTSLFLMDHQLGWMLDLGGLDAVVARTTDSSSRIYAWAEARDFASPYVPDPAERSLVVCTIDLEGVEAADVCAALRENGIVDVNGYRGLRRNQLRIGTFPAIDPDDITALTRCIDHVVGELRG